SGTNRPRTARYRRSRQRTRSSANAPVIVKTAAPPKHSKILILDFGSQYTQVIARRIRELQVYSEVVPFNLSAAEIKKLQPNGMILSGGPASVYDKGAPQIDKKIFSLGVPVLGICYGLMQMAHHLGGEVVFTGRREYGAGMLQLTDGSQLDDGLLHRGSLRAGAATGRRRKSRARSQRRCRFIGHGRTFAQSDRRPAHLHLCEQRSTP